MKIVGKYHHFYVKMYGIIKYLYVQNILRKKNTNLILYLYESMKIFFHNHGKISPIIFVILSIVHHVRLPIPFSINRFVFFVFDQRLTYIDFYSFITKDLRMYILLQYFRA